MKLVSDQLKQTKSFQLTSKVTYFDPLPDPSNTRLDLFIYCIDFVNV